jgi:hypothetical protein
MVTMPRVVQPCAGSRRACLFSRPSTVSGNPVSNITILLFVASNNGSEDNMVIANTTLITGIGTGCPSGSQLEQCDRVFLFSTPTMNGALVP